MVAGRGFQHERMVGDMDSVDDGCPGASGTAGAQRLEQLIGVSE